MQPIEPLMPWDMGASRPRWSEVLRDQSHVSIRPICKDDAAAERAFIEALSPQARRFRFLGQMEHPSNEMIQRFTDLDYAHDLAFAATAHDDPKHAFVGVARYSTSTDGTECECAITVLDDWHGKGLGSVLMKHLIDVARCRGVKRMWSIDAASNTAMTDLAHYMGFSSRQDPDDASQVIHSLLL